MLVSLYYVCVCVCAKGGKWEDRPFSESCSGRMSRSDQGWKGEMSFGGDVRYWPGFGICKIMSLEFGGLLLIKICT